VRHATRIVAVLLAVLFYVSTEAGKTALAHDFGDRPLDDVLYWARQVNKCSGLSTHRLAAMMLAPTWPETVGGSTAPSPMTMSRADIQRNLFSFSNPSGRKRAFWHPGIGMWQLDSAGMGANLAIHRRMNTYSSARRVARAISTRYCNSSGTPRQRRAAAWAPWFACSGGRCEALFQEHYCAGSDRVCNISRRSDVGRWGGMRKRTCRYASPEVRNQQWTCWYINWNNAQGTASSWTQEPRSGNYPSRPSPLALPLYSYFAARSSHEYRHWIQNDTPFEVEVYSSREAGRNARAGLRWRSTGGVLCDATRSRGAC
jgi:hypothetical protein